MSWLYLPERAVACSEPSICSDGKPSAMSSGTSTPSKFSKQGSETDTLTMLQSGTIVLPSTGDRGLDSWMSSLRDFHASRSVLREKDSLNTIHATDGLLLSASFAKYNPDLRSWRTFQVSYLSPITDEYLGTWPKRVSISNKIAYLHKKSVHRIYASDSGLFPTPIVSHSSWMRSHGKRSWMLSGMALHNKWPTYGTPNTKGIDGSKHQRIAAKKNGMFITHSGGKLNPNWVEWLMGWPIGWTDLKPLATGKFRQWLRKHGKDSAENNDA